MKLRKVLAIALAAVLCLALFAGCGDTGENNSPSPAPSDSSSPAANDNNSPAPDDSGSPAGSDGASGRVYWLNFKPESDGALNQVAQMSRKSILQNRSKRVKIEIWKSKNL